MQIPRIGATLIDHRDLKERPKPRDLKKRPNPKNTTQKSPTNPKKPNPRRGI
jgi:hypothetical protein